MYKNYNNPPARSLLLLDLDDDEGVGNVYES